VSTLMAERFDQAAARKLDCSHVACDWHEKQLCARLLASAMRGVREDESRMPDCSWLRSHVREVS